MEKRSFSVLSSDKKHTLRGCVYLPSGEACGLFQVVHGMTEYIGRYDRLMSDLAREGWIVFGYDHLGHGRTVDCDCELGYIARKDGWKRLVEDVGVFASAVKREFSDRLTAGYKYCLLGHSMGSFIARLASEQTVKPDRLIVMGTGGPNPIAGLGLAVIKVVKLFKGEKHVSPLVNKLAFGSYNKRFGGGSKGDPKPWLTTDVTTRVNYYADKYCSFDFTVSAMADLIKLTKGANREEWFSSVPSDMPILLVSGEDDPVGDYGKGVIKVHELLIANGRQAEIKLYKGARHEIINEPCYPTVRDDILEFCK